MKKEYVSYSLHISNSKRGSAVNSISTMRDLIRVMMHNYRLYEKATLGDKQYNSNGIYSLIGDENLVQNVRDMYLDLFEESRLEYNKTQTRKDRKIDDYLESIAKDKRKDIAVEMIIQIGDYKFYEEYGFQNHKEEFIKLFQKQLDKLETLLPNFKIANAVIHFDESSPHIQIVGIPYTEGLKRGMSKQASKNKVFTKETLATLQNEMRSGVLEDFRKIYPNIEIDLKNKEEGRNKDFTISEWKKVQKDLDNQFNNYVEKYDKRAFTMEEKLKGKTNEFNKKETEIKEIENEKILLEKNLKDKKEKIKELNMEKIDLNLDNNALRLTNNKLKTEQDKLKKEKEEEEKEIERLKQEKLKEYEPTEEEIEKHKQEKLKEYEPSKEEIEKHKQEKLKEYEPSEKDYDKAILKHMGLEESDRIIQPYHRILNDEIIEDYNYIKDIADRDIFYKDELVHITKEEIDDKIRGEWFNVRGINEKMPMYKIFKLFSFVKTKVLNYITQSEKTENYIKGNRQIKKHDEFIDRYSKKENDNSRYR